MRYDSAENDEIERLRQKNLVLKKKKNKINLYIPHRLRFPLVWTLFFTIIGIIQQSIILKKFVFIQFFTSNYLDWFSSFGNFAERYAAESFNEVLFLMLQKWYYFLFTGGIISIIWVVIYLIVHLEIESKKNEF